jgi:2-keto-4-pentenoate hydratase/2-oxohepta-3-ene-1,7-dioic acid hydratase in catechol pathway
MKIVRFDASGSVKYGIFENHIIHGCQGSPFDRFGGLGTLLPLDGSVYRLDEVRLLAPCTPSKYVGIGLNFRKAAEHMKVPLPAIPIMFLKPTTSVIGPDDNIVLPDASSNIIHEGELAIVIGKTAKDIPEERARDYVLGYTCTNDISDLSAFEEDRGNPTRTKGHDCFGPIGPWIETDVDPDDLRIEVRVNGELRQAGSTSDFIFGINKMINFVSSVMTLLPGDVIATGTPPGTGRMKAGDVVEVKVDKVGILRNSVIGAV